jgi:hypothetical protein
VFVEGAVLLEGHVVDQEDYLGVAFLFGVALSLEDVLECLKEERFGSEIAVDGDELGSNRD